MKKLFFDCGTRDPLASLGLFVLRAGTGLMMLYGHGIPKIGKFETIKDGWLVPDFFPLRYMSPPVSLVATIGAEVVAAAFLILGFSTRISAFVFSFAMVVAAFLAHGADPFAKKELALLYLLAGVVIIITGAGKYSLDSVIYQEKRRR
ncbi:MAG: DoxX family protein [Luteolibacter sp.]